MLENIYPKGSKIIFQEDICDPMFTIDQETTQITKNNILYKWIVLFINIRTLLISNKRFNHAIFHYMDGSRGYSAEWEQSEDRDKYKMISAIWDYVDT